MTQETAAAIHVELDNIEVRKITHTKGRLVFVIEADDDSVAGEEQLKRLTREGFKGPLIIEGQYEQQAIDWSEGSKDGQQPPQGEAKKP